MDSPLLFALTVLAILATPGPTNTLLAIGGATAGLRRSLTLVPAEAAGYMISILTLGLQVAPLLTQVAVLATALRIVVGVYLLYLAVRLWRRPIADMATSRPVTPAQVFLTTLLNPKGLLFALGVVPFGSPHVWTYLVGFLAILVPVSLAWVITGTGVGRLAWRGGWQQRITRAGAVVIGMFAVVVLGGPLLH